MPAQDCPPPLRRPSFLVGQPGLHRYSRLDTHYPLDRRFHLIVFLEKSLPAKLLRATLADAKAYDGVKFIAK